MIALGKEQQTARGFEIERLAASAERTDHHSARCRERLFRRPHHFLALGGADYDQPLKVQAELREARRIRRALFGEDAFLPGPENLPAPGRGQAETKPDGSRLRAWPCRAKLMQRLSGHSGGSGLKSAFRGGKGDWTRTHVLYMFLLP